MLFAQSSHFSVTVPLIYRVLKHINKAKVKTENGKSFARKMSIELLRRLNDKPKETMLVLLKAMIMDPRFKDVASSQDQLDIHYPFFKDNNITCSQALSGLRAQFKSLCEKHRVEEVQEIKRSKESTVLDDDEDDEIGMDPLESYLKVPQVFKIRQKDESRRVLIDICDNCRDSCYIAAFKDLCKYYWCVPATNIAAESSFSLLGFILSPKRLILSDKNIQNYHFYKKNRDFCQTDTFE